MLKHLGVGLNEEKAVAAAFGRLCVETYVVENVKNAKNAAAFGRLCVETLVYYSKVNSIFAAAFGRLCVETGRPGCMKVIYERQPPSGGCVLKHYFLHFVIDCLLQPPSGGCVLKHLKRL